MTKISKDEQGRNKFFIRAEKYNDKEILEKYPNLTAPIWVKIGEVRTHLSEKKLREKDREELKDAIEMTLEQDVRLPEKWDWQDKQKVDLIPAGERDEYDPLFEGEIELPKDKIPEKEESASKTDEDSLGGRGALM